MASAQAGAGSLPFLYSDFHGGLNTLNAPYLLNDDEARDLQNIQGTTAGAIIKRNGFSTFASPANTLTSLFALESTASPFLIGTGGTAMYSISSGGTVTSIGGSAFTSGKRWEFISGPTKTGSPNQGPLYGLNGTDTPQTWVGTGSTTAWTATDSGGTVPNGQYVVYNQNQVFVAGTSSNPSRVYWSGLADPTAWNPANLNGSGFMDFDPNDGQSITGLGVVGPYVLVGKPRKLWVIINPATATARMISNNIGIAAHRSIAQGAEGTYFLSEDRGVFVTNGSKLTPISDKIKPDMDAIVSGNRGIAAGAYFGNHYYLSVSNTDGTNNVTYDYDATLGSWWKHTVAENQWAIWHPSGAGTAAQLYGAKSSSAIVDQCFVSGVYQDNGSNFTWAWRGPWQSPTFYRRRRFPTPYFRKRLRQVRFDGAGTVDFSLAKDFAGAETLIRANALAGISGNFGGTGTFGASDGSFFGDGTVQRARVLGGLGVANAFSIVFSATSNSADSVYSYTLIMTDRRDLIVA